MAYLQFIQHIYETKNLKHPGPARCCIIGALARACGLAIPAHMEGESVQGPYMEKPTNKIASDHGLQITDLIRMQNWNDHGEWQLLSSFLKGHSLYEKVKKHGVEILA